MSARLISWCHILCHGILERVSVDHNLNSLSLETPALLSTGISSCKADAEACKFLLLLAVHIPKGISMWDVVTALFIFVKKRPIHQLARKQFLILFDTSYIRCRK